MTPHRLAEDAEEIARLRARVAELEQKAERQWQGWVKCQAALKDLLESANLLQENAEGCAVNHYGDDSELHGMPGWLADTAASISRARRALTTETTDA